MKYKLTVEYDGSKFSGWQVQDGVPTVQGAIERALSTLLGAEAKRLGVAVPEAPNVTSSGRTDRGVHARGQVISFSWPELGSTTTRKLIPMEAQRLRRALNGILRHQLYFVDISEMPDSFDARHSPHLKCYTYRLRTRPYSAAADAAQSWCVGELNLAPMLTAARAVVGTHDFSSFRASDCTAKSTERTILVSELSREPGVSTEGDVIYSICGKGFLKQMVRIIVGTLVEIGRGRRPESDISRLLALGKRHQAGPTAPAKGLTLEWVRYLEEEYWR